MKSFWSDPDDFQPSNICNAWVATAIVGAAVVGAGANIYGANKAADAQKDAVNSANATELGMYNTTRGDLLPYIDMGTDAGKILKNNNYYSDPIVMDQAALEKTPGYQFTKEQGLKAVQNSAAARGLGVSGAALKGAANFTTGLADKTYLDQFGVANTNQTNAYTRLKGLVDTGESAAAKTGTVGAQIAGQVGSNTIGAGNASAAAANATGGAVANAFNNIGGYAAYKGLYGSNPSVNTSVPNNGSGIYTGDPTIPGFANGRS